MFELIAKTPAYRLFYKTGFTFMLPSTLAVSVTNRCNARCKICGVYKKSRDELTVDEYKKIFKSLSKAPRWYTITGGEPFMRQDIPEVIDVLAEKGRPDAITVATNGYLTDAIIKFATRFVADHSKVRLILNISFDAIGPSHDKIRGLQGTFERARETLFALRALNRPDNLQVGVNTVISKYNIDSVMALRKYIAELKPDTHVFEPAQPRAELLSDKMDIEPDSEKLAAILREIANEESGSDAGFMPEMITKFRREYYRLAAKIAEQKEQVIPCYAGIISAHISTNGSLWPCCTLARSMGNLRDAGYNFEKIWQSREATAERKFIREKRCYCSLANAYYTNIIMNTRSMSRVFADLAFKRQD